MVCKNLEDILGEYLLGEDRAITDFVEWAETMRSEKLDARDREAVNGRLVETLKASRFEIYLTGPGGSLNLEDMRGSEKAFTEYVGGFSRAILTRNGVREEEAVEYVTSKKGEIASKVKEDFRKNGCSGLGMIINNTIIRDRQEARRKAGGSAREGKQDDSPPAGEGGGAAAPQPGRGQYRAATGAGSGPIAPQPEAKGRDPLGRRMVFPAYRPSEGSAGGEHEEAPETEPREALYKRGWRRTKEVYKSSTSGMGRMIDAGRDGYAYWTKRREKKRKEAELRGKGVGDRSGIFPAFEASERPADGEHEEAPETEPREALYKRGWRRTKEVYKSSTSGMGRMIDAVGDGYAYWTKRRERRESAATQAAGHSESAGTEVMGYAAKRLKKLTTNCSLAMGDLKSVYRSAMGGVRQKASEYRDGWNAFWAGRRERTEERKRRLEAERDAMPPETKKEPAEPLYKRKGIRYAALPVLGAALLAGGILLHNAYKAGGGPENIKQPTATHETARTPEPPKPSVGPSESALSSEIKWRWKSDPSEWGILPPAKNSVMVNTNGKYRIETRVRVSDGKLVNFGHTDGKLDYIGIKLKGGSGKWFYFRPGEDVYLQLNDDQMRTLQSGGLPYQIVGLSKPDGNEGTYTRRCSYRNARMVPEPKTGRVSSASSIFKSGVNGGGGEYAFMPTGKSGPTALSRYYKYYELPGGHYTINTDLFATNLNGPMAGLYSDAILYKTGRNSA